MMPVGVDTVQVSLSDALQVNGKPLNEEEIWSVLSKSTESIQDIFLKGQALADDGPSFVVSPYTLLLCVDGRVVFTESIDMAVPDLRRFIPPEGLTGIDHFTEPVVEKMYIYALGQTLLWCSEYGRSVFMSFADRIQSLLTSMCNKHPDHRSSLVHILEACAIHAQNTSNAIPFAWHITRLNRIILGNVDELDKIGQDEDHFYVNSNGNNSRVMDDQRYFHRGTPPVFQFGKPPPFPSLSSQEHHHSQLGRSRRDEPDNADREPPRSREISHHITGIADPREDVPDPHQTSNHGYDSFSSEDDDDDDGRSYHVSDITSSPSIPMPQSPRRPQRYLLRNRSRSHSRSRSRDRSRSRSRTPSRRPGPSSLERTASQVHERLRDRREKLSALREQLRTRRPDPPHTFPVDPPFSDSESVQSDIDDIKRNIRELRRKGKSQKSLMSMESAQEGSFHPGQMSPAASMPSIPHRLQQETRRHSRQHSPPDLRRSDPSWSPGRDRRQQRDRNPEPERERRPAARKLKKFFGPEFVVMSGASYETIDMAPSMMCKTGKVSPERKQVVVMLLNGKRLELMCDLGTSGQDLFETVVAYLHLVEKSYFGLAHIKDGEYMFLDTDSKIYKVGPESWRSEVKRGVARSSKTREKLTLFFRVKFYVDNVNILKNLEDTARHNFYLQLRRDLLEERVKCKDPEGLHLGSLALQVEMGEYDHEKMAQNYFLPEHYIPAGIIESMGVSAIRRKLPVLHQEHEDMTEEEAEFGFLIEARKLSEYGIHFHKVSKAKKSSKESVWLGICARGIIVYDRNGSRRSQIHAHPWPMTKKVAFKRKKFIVEPNDSSGFKFVHYTDNYKKGNYLLQLCKAQHRFHMTMRNKAQISQKFQEEYPSPLKYDTPEREADFGHDVHFSDDDSGGDNYEDNYPEESFAQLPGGSDYPINQSEPALNIIRSDRPSYLRRHSEHRGGETTLPNRSQGVPRGSNLSKARSVDTGRRFLDDDDDPLLGSTGRPLRNHARQEDYDSLTEEDFSSHEEGLEEEEPYRTRSDWPETRSRRRLSPTLMEERTEREADPPYATIDSIRTRKRESEKRHSTPRSRSRPQKYDDHPYVVDTSIHTKDESYQPEREAFSPLSDTLLDRLSDMPSPEVPERDIVIVTLKKDPRIGIGLTIVGGENSGSLDLGIFVKEVVAHGPASRDGRIFPGDRIISINGQSLEGVSHRVAVDIIQRARDSVQLILSQPRTRRSPREVALPEAPYANMDLSRSHSFSVAPKLPPPDRKAHRSNSSVSYHSRQTPPVKPRRNPQSFGSSYSLVISDSDSLLSETEIRRIEEQQSFLPSVGVRDSPRGLADRRGGGIFAQSPPEASLNWSNPVSITQEENLGGGKADREFVEPRELSEASPLRVVASAGTEDPRTDRRSSGGAPAETRDTTRTEEEPIAQDAGERLNVSRGNSPIFQVDHRSSGAAPTETKDTARTQKLPAQGESERLDVSPGYSPTFQMDHGSSDAGPSKTKDAARSQEKPAALDESERLNVSRGYSPTFEMDFDDDFSDEVPTPDSSEMEDLFGNEGERKFDVNLMKSLKKSPLSASEDEEEEEPANRERGDNVSKLTRSTENLEEYTGAKVEDVESAKRVFEPGDAFTVELRTINGSLGINVTAGINTSFKHGGIYVKTLVPGGAAEREGQIMPGDRVLQVAGSSLTSVTHRQAVEILRNIPDVSVLQVERGRPLAETALPLTPVNLSKEDLLDEGTSVDGENMAPPQEVEGSSSGGEEEGGEGGENVPEIRGLLDENTEQFTPPPEEEEVITTNGARILPSSNMLTTDTLKKTEDGLPSSEVGKVGSDEYRVKGDTKVESTPDHAAQIRGDPHEPLSSEEESSIESSEEDDEVNDLFADTASPGLSTREADTLTPTSHLVTPTRGLFRGQVRAPSNPRLHRKSIDDEDRYSSAVSEITTDAKSTTPTSSFRPEDDGHRSGGGSLNPSGIDSQESDTEYGSFVRGGTFDSSHRALEIEPSILPVMEEELADGLDKDSLEFPEMKAKVGAVSGGRVDGPEGAADRRTSLQEAATRGEESSNVISDEESEDEVEPTKIPDLPYVTPGNCFEVELRKGTEGLGLSVQGGLGAHKDPRLCTVRIKKMFPGQAAARSGLVEEGDVILAVNGEHIHNVPHADVVGKLRATPQVVRLLICRPSQEELNALLKSSSRIKPQEEGSPRKVVQPPRGDVSVAPPSLSTPPSFTREKSETTAPDLNTSLDVDSNEDHSLSEGVATTTGKNEDYIEVSLMKPIRGGLGFTVAGGVNTGGCYIKDVITDPALADGRLKKGDKIISVNGKDMEHMNHFEAVTFLRMTPREVILRVKRPVNRYDLPAPEELTSPASETPRGTGDIKSEKETLSSREEPGCSETREPAPIHARKQKEASSSSGVLSDRPVNVLPLEPFRGDSVVGNKGWSSFPRRADDVKDDTRATGPSDPRRIDDSDIDLGDLTGEDSEWEDLSSGSGSESGGEIDEILAVLEPMHGRGGEEGTSRPSEPGTKPENGSRKEASTVVKDNEDGTILQKDEVLESPGDLKDTAKDGETDSTSEEPPPIPAAPPPPLTPTSDRSGTPPPSVAGTSGEENPNTPSNPSKNISYDTERHVGRTLEGSSSPVMSEDERIRGTMDEEKFNVNTEDTSGRRLMQQEQSFEEEDVDNSVLDEILNQDDSFDDITFGDMLSSGSEPEEEGDSQSLEEAETDILDRLTRDLEEPLERGMTSGTPRDVRNGSPSLLTIADNSFRNMSQLAPPDEKKPLSPSPVMVTPPVGRLTLTPRRNSSSASDRSSLAMPSIKEDAPPSAKETTSEVKEGEDVPLEKDLDQSLSEEEESLKGPSIDLDNSEDHSFSDFSFSDAQLPMPSSRSPSPPPKVSTDRGSRERSSIPGATSAGGASPPLPDSPDLPPPSLERDKEPSTTWRDEVSIPFAKEGFTQNPQKQHPAADNSLRERGSFDKSDVERSMEGTTARLSFTPRSARQVLSIQRETLFDSDRPSYPSSQSTEVRGQTSDVGSDPSPRSVLSVRSPETALGKVTSGDVKPTRSSSGPESSLQSRRHDHSEDELLANEDIDQVPSKIVSLLRRPPSTGSEASESGVYRVDLNKPPTGGLGLSLVGAVKGGMTSVFVKSITPGGVTDQDGRIQIGDKVLQVNGQSTVGMTQSKVVSLLRKAHGTVKLTLACVKAPTRPTSMVIGTDRDSDTRPPLVPPLDLQADLSQSDPSHPGRGHSALGRPEEELSQTESCSESPRRAGSRAEIPPHHLTANDQLFTAVTNDSFLAAPTLNLNLDTLGSVSLLTPPQDFASTEEWTDRDTDSDIESAADLPDDSLLDLLDDRGDAVAIETAMKATRQIGRVLKDKIQGKDDVSFGSDIGFPLTSEDESSLHSDCSKRSQDGPSSGGSADGALQGLEVLRVPKTCKLYSGKSLKNIISGLEKKIEKLNTEDEFKSLRQVKVVDACEVARGPENRDKNRFRNVLPYDETRVVLRRSGGSDYINASHVQVMVAGTEYRYLACQGPLPQTCNDFWDMIWEQEVAVIAMVTLNVENGKVKCHKYWPEGKDSALSMGDLEIMMEDVQHFDNFVIRNLVMTDVKSKEVHRVTHLNFTSWPDHSVPHSAVPLLRFARYMHKINTGSGPIAVHCSAGIGRSGTLITIDLLLAMIEAGQEFNILELVKELRLQRQGMVQTKDQYTFCYQAAVEALKVLP